MRELMLADVDLIYHTTLRDHPSCLAQMEKYGVFVECKAGGWGSFGKCTKACGKGTV